MVLAAAGAWPPLDGNMAATEAAATTAPVPGAVMGRRQFAWSRTLGSRSRSSFMARLTEEESAFMPPYQRPRDDAMRGFGLFSAGRTLSTPNGALWIRSWTMWCFRSPTNRDRLTNELARLFKCTQADILTNSINNESHLRSLLAYDQSSSLTAWPRDPEVPCPRLLNPESSLNSSPRMA